MNARLAALVLVGAVAFVGVGGGDVARAQTAATGAPAVSPIPVAAQQAGTNAEIGKHRPAIDAFIAARVASLLGDDPAARAAARDALTGNQGGALPGNATLVYFNAYASSLNAALLPALANAGDVQRLNAAICVAKVSDRVNNSALAGVVRLLLKDQTEAVVLWGLKAAAPMVPVIAGNPLDANAALLPELVATAKARGSNGWIVDDAYSALTPNLAARNLQPAQFSATVNAILPQVHAMLLHRVSEFSKGVPPAPSADIKATNFFVVTSVWKAMTPAQQFDSIQLMADLLGAATTQFAARQDERPKLTQLVIFAGKAFQLVGDFIGSAPVTAAGQVVSQSNQGTAPGQLAQNVSALLTVTKSIPTFKDLRVGGVSPASTQPAAAARAAE